MDDRNMTRFGLAAAGLVLLSCGVAMQAQAQDQPLVPGADCSRLLASEQTECVRTMRRLELRQMEDQGSVAPAPDPGASAIQRPTVPDTAGDPSSLAPDGGQPELPPGALDGAVGD